MRHRSQMQGYGYRAYHHFQQYRYFSYIVAVSFIVGGNGDWNSSVHNFQKTFNHRIFKIDFKFEKYFNMLD